MDTKTARRILGMPQRKFAETFSIPLRTIENWEQGKRKPPAYVLNLLDFALKDRLKGEEMDENVKVDEAIKAGTVFAEQLDGSNLEKIRQIILDGRNFKGDGFINQLIEVGLAAGADASFLIDLTSVNQEKRLKQIQGFVLGITSAYERE